MTGAAFAVLFGAPLAGLARDWWTDPDAGHGLLLAPVAIWLAWRVGISRDSTPSMGLGAVALVAAIALRHLGGLAAEVFSTRISALLAIAGVVTFWFGWRQVRAWWLSFALLALAIPLPSLITTALTLPLQFKASAMGAALLEMRHVPVMLSGNIIRLPGHQLFVTEACSGLRSLTALLSLGVLIGGLWLRSPASRLTLVALAVPVGIVINAVRVFLTGFLVYFVSPKMGDGFMHLTEGWLLFLAAFAVLGICGWVLGQVERRFLGREAESHA
jgi:exosortase